LGASAGAVAKDGAAKLAGAHGSPAQCCGTAPTQRAGGDAPVARDALRADGSRGVTEDLAVLLADVAVRAEN